MKLEKAIKIITDYLGTGPEAEPVEFNKAIALGAQALKEIGNIREWSDGYKRSQLPGETED